MNSDAHTVYIDAHTVYTAHCLGNTVWVTPIHCVGNAVQWCPYTKQRCPYCGDCELLRDFVSYPYTRHTVHSGAYIITKGHKRPKQTEKLQYSQQSTRVHFPQLSVQREINDPPIKQIPGESTSRKCSTVLVPAHKTRHWWNRKGTVKTDNDDSRIQKQQLRPPAQGPETRQPYIKKEN